MADLPAAESQEVLEFPDQVRDWDERLRQAGVGSAEQAFGMGCGIALLPTLAVIGLLLIFRVINIILAAVLLVMALLVLAGLGMLFANIARTNNARRTYETSIQPEIASYLQQTGMPRAEFERQVVALLPADAPLQTFLNRQPSLPQDGSNA